MAIASKARLLEGRPLSLRGDPGTVSEAAEAGIKVTDCRVGRDSVCLRSAEHQSRAGSTHYPTARPIEVPTVPSPGSRVLGQYVY